MNATHLARPLYRLRTGSPTCKKDKDGNSSLASSDRCVVDERDVWLEVFGVVETEAKDV